MKNKIYMNKYIIGIYNKDSEDDSCITVLDNAREFAEFMQIKIQQARVVLSKAFNHKIGYIRLNNMRCEIVFIEM